MQLRKKKPLNKKRKGYARKNKNEQRKVNFYN